MGSRPVADAGENADDDDVGFVALVVVDGGRYGARP
jgi:hypothetical protein